MWQVEYTEGLPHYLINNVVIAAVETGTVQVDHVHLAWGFQPVVIIVSAQRQQFIVLVRDVGVDVQFHILGGERREAQSQLYAAVAHRAQVVQQLIVTERRHTHVIQVEHVGRFGCIEIKRCQDVVAQESGIQACAETTFHFPLEVGIGIAQLIEGHIQRLTNRSDARRHEQILGHVTVHTAQVARQTITDIPLQIIKPTDTTQERLISQVPRCRYRGEIAPFVALTELAGAVGTQRGGKRVTAQVVIGHPCHERRQRRRVMETACAVPQGHCTRLDGVNADSIGRKTCRGGIEARMGVALNLGQSHHIDMMRSQRFVPSHCGEAQQRFRLGATTIALAAAPDARGQELGNLHLVVAVGPEE